MILQSGARVKGRYMATTAEKLVALRTEKGLTQQELADRMFVSRSLVSLWELGTRMPGYSNVIMMSELFNVSAEEIVDDEKYAYSSGELGRLFEEVDELTDRTEGKLETPGTVIRQFLRKLSKKDRDIFMGRYFSAKTAKAIAAECSMNEAAVKMRLTRMRKKLRKMISEGDSHEVQ